MNTVIDRKKYIEKYYQQECLLPHSIKEKLKGKMIELYALVDMNHQMEFEDSWLVLVEDALIHFTRKERGFEIEKEIKISSISRIKEHQSLSSFTYEFLTADDMPPLLTIHFTGRQKITMGNLKYLVDNKIDGIVHVKPRDWNPDDEYQKSLLEVGSYRRQVGMVLQDPYLFHGTIIENIRYGLPEIGLEKVIEAAKIANAHEFIMRFDQGYETIVGERGHTLSGGERQRISIARAILHDPKILILDEATSAVDTETERKIQDALDKLIEGRTVFAVAHRLSTLRKANRIVVIDKGEIKETGSHVELLKKKEGMYTKLHRMQQEMSDSFLQAD